MARKLIDIENEIKASSNDFNRHLNSIISTGVIEFIEKLKSITQVYLFSGVIRNYFIKKNESLRDLDLIIEDELDIDKLFPNLNINKNSFGGYKITIDNLTIDLWIIKNTWGLNNSHHGQRLMPLDYLDYLPNTTFFNFSSIIFSLNNYKFIVGKPFLRFLRDKEIDVVLNVNPYPALCIVNTFYYSEKYNLKLSSKLKKYIIENYNLGIEKYNEAQIKHFNQIIYTIDDLYDKINRIK